MMKNYERAIKYMACISVSVILVIIAILAPQLLLTVQDNFRLEQNWQGKRVSLDMEALNNSYGSLRERLISFADGVAQDKEYYVAGTDYQVTEETYDLIEQVYEQEIFELFLDLGLSLFSSIELFEKGFNVEACKKYFIYDDSLEGGATSIVAMAWYIELQIADVQRIKILADAENHTVYYAEYFYVENDADNMGMNKKGKTEIYSKQQLGIIDAFSYLFHQCCAYYEAGNNEPVTEEEAWSIDTNENRILSETGALLQTQMVYGVKGNSLTLEMGTEYGKMYLGIRELKELIPEFK